MEKKSFKRDSHALIDELWEQIENLQSQCKEFGRGNFSLYKSMSVILRTVLVGSSGYPALLGAVLPNSSYYPLRIIPVQSLTKGIVTPAEIVVTNDQGGELHYSAGGTMPYLGIDGGGVVLSKVAPVGGDVIWRTEVKNMFDIMGRRLPLAVWLAQPFLRPNWSIKSFIRCVAHKDGGAHVDDSDQLRAMKAFGNIHRHFTERISRYLAAEIAVQLQQTYPMHCRSVR